MKIFACAALLLASCGGTQTAGEQAQTPETKTAVKHGPEIALLKPDPKSGMTVNEALQNRRSWREYAPEALSLEELSGVMWAAGGINRPQDGRLTAPSALALYPIRIYAFFPEGVYRYDAKGQKLVRVTEGDHRNLAGHSRSCSRRRSIWLMWPTCRSMKVRIFLPGMSATFAGRMPRAMPKTSTSTPRAMA